MNETTEAQQWADLAPADLLTFSVYKPERGAPIALDKDGLTGGADPRREGLAAGD
jgi:hypothetical protein